MLKVIFKFLIISTVLFSSLQAFFHPQLHLVKVTDSDALCLDGSQAAYYISKGGDPKKIYLGFEGGGWCYGPHSINQTLDDCFQRTKQSLGSSNWYPEILQVKEGILSNNEQNNFKDWTRVLLKYCDGSGHQGTRRNPILYKGKNLYFRGHNATVGQLNSLQRQIKLFSQATHVVIGGESAGGLAVFLWTNYIKERVKIGKVWAIPDCGIFLDSTHILSGKNDYKNMFKNLMSITNVEIAPPVPECVSKFKNEIENCMFAVNLAPHIKAPMFIIQSLYDSWSIPTIVGVGCMRGASLAYCSSHQRSVIEDYHKNTTNAIFDMTAKNLNINGFFAPVCANHVYSIASAYYHPYFRIPKQSDNSIAQGIQNWINGSAPLSTYRLIDLGQWPDNLPCAGQVIPFNI